MHGGTDRQTTAHFTHQPNGCYCSNWHYNRVQCKKCFTKLTSEFCFSTGVMFRSHRTVFVFRSVCSWLSDCMSISCTNCWIITANSPFIFSMNVVLAYNMYLPISTSSSVLLGTVRALTIISSNSLQILYEKKKGRILQISLIVLRHIIIPAVAAAHWILSHICTPWCNS